VIAKTNKRPKTRPSLNPKLQQSPYRGGGGRMRPGGRKEKRGGMEKATREETIKEITSKDRILQAKTWERGVRKQGHQGPHSNKSQVETQVPALQAEQVEDDVAPVTAEYVPAKPRDEEYGYVDSNRELEVNTRKEKARTWRQVHEWRRLGLEVRVRVRWEFVVRG
jgi:hypothetical protein